MDVQQRHARLVVHEIHPSSIARQQHDRLNCGAATLKYRRHKRADGGGAALHRNTTTIAVVVVIVIVIVIITLCCCLLGPCVRPTVSFVCWKAKGVVMLGALG